MMLNLRRRILGPVQDEGEDQEVPLLVGIIGKECAGGKRITKSVIEFAIVKGRVL